MDLSYNARGVYLSPAVTVFDVMKFSLELSYNARGGCVSPAAIVFDVLKEKDGFFV